MVLRRAQAQADARWQLKERAESARAELSLRSKSLRRSNGRRRSTLKPSHRRSNVYVSSSHLREMLRQTVSVGSCRVRVRSQKKLARLRKRSLMFHSPQTPNERICQVQGTR